MTEPDREDSMTHFNDSFTMTIDGKAVSSHAMFEAIHPATEEVIDRANDSEYGLAGSVWGKDLDRARRLTG